MDQRLSITGPDSELARLNLHLVNTLNAEHDPPFQTDRQQVNITDRALIDENHALLPIRKNPSARPCPFTNLQNPTLSHFRSGRVGYGYWLPKSALAQSAHYTPNTCTLVYQVR